MNGIAGAWARLGIPATDDRREVKKAYGRALKAIDPDSDPQAFLSLREAYEAALQWGTARPFWEEEAEEEDALEEVPAANHDDSESGSVCSCEEDDRYWEAWRPEPPAPAGSDGLREACLELDRLLFDGPPPPPERIAAAGAALMARPELAEVDRLTETELWLAEAITASSPRSDPLIEPAVARFGWKRAERDWRRHYQIAAVLGRREDIAFLERCRRPVDMHRRAVEALTSPPPARLPLAKLGLAGDVARFLEAVANEWPTVERDLDPGSVAWWRAYLHGRHLSPNFLTWMAVVPLAVTLAAAIPIAGAGRPDWLLLPIFFLALLATGGLLSAKAELDARARAKGSAWSGDPAPAAGIERIVVPALLLPPLVALLPDGTLWTSLSLTGSLALAAGGLRRGWVEPEWAVSHVRRLFLPVVAAVVGMTALALGSAEAALKLAPPLLALSWLGARAFAPVRLRLEAAPRRARLALMAAALAAAGLAAWAIVLAVAGGSPALWAILLAPSAIVAGHLATAESPVDLHFVEWPLRAVAALLYFSLGFLADELFWMRVVAPVSAYGLLYAAVRIAAAIAHEARRPLEEPA